MAVNHKALQEAREWAAASGENIDVAWGYKIKDGKITNEQCVVFNVPEKKPKEELLPMEAAPEKISGVNTDVVEGHYHALAQDRHRPSLGGDSFGHEDITAGTLGGPVLADGQLMALTNAHVAYPHWEGAAIGDRVVQPGPYDIRDYYGDVPSNQIYNWGKVHAGVTINFRGGLPGKDKKNQAFALKWWKAVKALGNLGAQAVDCPYRVSVAPYDIPQPTPNRVDAAVVRPDFTDNLGLEIRGLGVVAGIIDPVLGLEVVKHGRTTDITRGRITAIESTASVSYGTGRIADFDHQAVVRGNDGAEFSAGGDSGSMVFTEIDGELYWCGLLFAGGGGQTIINYASEVVRLLGVMVA